MCPPREDQDAATGEMAISLASLAAPARRNNLRLDQSQQYASGGWSRVKRAPSAIGLGVDERSTPAAQN
jgi:hypothetical protein